MEIEIKAKALKTLDEVANFLESLNTTGSGGRWLDKFFLRIQAYAKHNVVYALCKNAKLAKRNFSCITFNNWVVAFQIIKGRLVIYEIIHGSLL
ncbi:MAG: hypothetical protein IPP77_12840 [Bacteroidetes bacterium]|nr:hypothetical protein [Bacteroidota bacterium]